MSHRIDQLRQAFDALNGGDVSRFQELLAEDAQWLGIPGSGVDGDTPI